MASAKPIINPGPPPWLLLLLRATPVLPVRFRSFRRMPPPLCPLGGHGAEPVGVSSQHKRSAFDDSIIDKSGSLNIPPVFWFLGLSENQTESFVSAIVCRAIRS
jgi:hypothetical protein